MAGNNFDPVANFYDALKWLVFGNALDNAAVHYFYRIPPGSRVLIIGGGTGKLLSELPKDLSVDYLEKSRKMIIRAKQNADQSDILFVHEDVFHFQPGQRYDAVIAPFVLDCFQKDRVSTLLKAIYAWLREDGILLVADFRPSRTWYQEKLLSTMYWFFGWSTGLEGKHLLDFDKMIHS
jgi:ubiquinone/menaquinone biosynthesis C-methylase UbiE